MLKTIRIVAADDSAVMRGLLTRMFATEYGGGHPRMELCATVPDGASCLHAVRTMHPDIVLMDLHMPGLGGMEAIFRLRREWPRLPIILCSSYTEAGAGETLEAFARGASDYVTKPTAQANAEDALALLWAQLAPKILAWASLNGAPGAVPAPRTESESRRSSKDRGNITIAGIGASTGGPIALERLLPRLPRDFPVPVLVVQHMPKLFTKALAERLDRCCSLRVREALHGAVLVPGTIWLAQGDMHMEVTSVGRGTNAATRLMLHQGASVQHCRPSVDVLFRSMAARFGAGALGVVLTGMGSDGLEGSRAITDQGGAVLAQDEASSAVWGMPGRVVAAGLARAVLPLNKLADELIAMTSSRAQAPISAEGSPPEVLRELY